MLILGISEIDNDAGAVLLKDGELVGAANEERFTRVKQQAGVPLKTIEWLLKKAGAALSDVNHMYVVRQDVHSEYSHTLKKLDQTKWFSWPGSLTHKILNYGIWKFRNYPKVREGQYHYNKMLNHWWRDQKYDVNNVSRLDHHSMHSACAYFGSGFEKALTLTADGQGDGKTATLSLWEGGCPKTIHEVYLPHSAGNFYASITKAAGYRPARHEGKITGLAARGKPDEECIAFSRRMLYNTDGSFEAPHVYGSYPALKLLLKKKGPENLAYAYQMVLEEVLKKYISQYIKITGVKNICLAGGVCANVRLNQKIREIPEVENIFIFPHMGDGGLGWGAAMWGWNGIINRDKPFTPKPIHDVYWGPSFNEEDIENALTAERIRYSRPENLEKVMANLLAQGELIARFNGAMEFGPRALCHRSIFYHPADPTVNDWLNKKLQRTEFMPFAPVTREEDAPKMYKNFFGAQHSSKFMTLTFDCTDEMIQSCPAVINVDGTARPQTISADTDISTYKVLTYFKENTGLSSFLNTSLNMHEEPIVCTSEDAIKACISAKFRYLAIGPFLAEFEFPSPPKNNLPPSYN